MEIISLTESAKKQVLEIIKTDNIYQEGQKTNKRMGLRVGVVGGGCSGFSYKIEFSEYRENDNVLSFGDFEVLIDPKSSIYLKDVQVDFKDGLDGKGFVFSNPNAKNTCGCGESFSV